MGHAAPIARLTLAYAAGVAAGLLGVPIVATPLLIALAIAPPRITWPRPRSVDGRVALLAVAAGLLIAHPADRSTCPVPAAGARTVLEGRFLVTPRAGSAPFRQADRCGDVTVVVDRMDRGLLSAGQGGRVAGIALAVEGVWQEGSRRPWLQATSVDLLSERVQPGVRERAQWVLVVWRDRLVDRLDRLYEGRAPLVAALVLARREGLDPSVRERFAVTGVAHLLAISGFHVGVVAGLLFALARAMGVTRPRAMLAATACAWVYVALIGFPDAACRAALIMACVALSRLRGHPPSRWGALACAALILLVLDPTRLGSPGFQLSFAGAAGLAAWSRAVATAIDGVGRRAVGRRLPRAVTTALAAGVAATAATLPVVAWHFERVSVVGIPVTLLVSPLVSLALPGAILSLLLDVLSAGAADFIAGGVSLLLDALLGLTGAVSGLPWASASVTRTTVLAASGGVLLAAHVARRPGIGRRTRHRLTVVYACAAVVAWPVLVSVGSRGSFELWMIDVGQGDAIAMRSPSGHWLLIDAGPPLSRGGGMHPVVHALKARGVRRIDTLILTHADADHFGGALDVLEAFSVGRIVDPALPVPKQSYLDVAEEAARLGVPWVAARSGMEIGIDGVQVRVLHPDDRVIERERLRPAPQVEANASSVVLLVSWRGFRALLTGDAYVDVEQELASEVGDVDLLKVGHHGSRTSTDSTFLAMVQPEIALISVGRRNRFGHPAPEVVRRLEAAGAQIRRTDREGSVRILIHPDGAISVTSSSKSR
jgi:competence protein ComEC